MKRVLHNLQDLGQYACVAGHVAEADAGEPAALLAWRIAAQDARAAYDEWRARRDRDSYAVYRACADRADAAQDGLAAR